MEKALPARDSNPGFIVVSQVGSGIPLHLAKRLFKGLCKYLPRGNGVMDSELADCACSPGSIPPAISKSNMHYSNGFSPSRYKVVGQENGAVSLISIIVYI